MELSACGLRVQVLEKGRVMSEASWAAAGMLAAEDPENPIELDALAGLSIQLYPSYLSNIENASGHAVPLRTRHTLQATRPAEHFECAQTASRKPISAEEAESRIPGLTSTGRSLLWIEEASLDPRDLCRALPIAATSRGVIVTEGAEVVAVVPHPNAVSIQTTKETLSAGAFVNCCGAWSAGISNPQSSLLNLDVEPRSGQMLLLQTHGQADLSQTLRTPDFYLVPRGNGRIVLGATVERTGFERKITHNAAEHLIALADELWPAVKLCTVEDHWAGLRPGTRDNLPILGRTGAPDTTDHCWIATGHFRNGILLAPATAQVMRQLIMGQTPAVSLARMSPQRFRE
jgi:glycine oxidase